MVGAPFSVDGTLPPKKDGASSMWNKAAVQPLVKALRCAAAEAFAGRAPYDEPVELRVAIRSTRDLAGDLWQRRAGGDLDNYITGICDGLQAAHVGSTRPDEWTDLAEAARPDHPIAFTDDSWIQRIVAEFVRGEPGYDVTVAPAGGEMSTAPTKRDARAGSASALARDSLGLPLRTRTCRPVCARGGQGGYWCSARYRRPDRP